MQVCAATLARLVRDGAKLALIRGPRGPATCACGGDSRCNIRSGKRAAETKGVDQLWMRILKLVVLPSSGQA
jgi:hypothetical protein